MRRLPLLITVTALLAGSLTACFDQPPPFCGDFSMSGDLAANCDPVPPGPPPPTPPPVCEACGGATGDPHLTTFDQTHYDMQGAGEYTAVLTSGFEVQIRTEPLSSLVSVTTGVGVGIGDDVVSIAVRDRELELVIGGVRTTVEPGDSIPVADAALVERVAVGQLIVRLDDGSFVDVEGVTGSSLDVHVYLSAERRPDVRGLFGDADGNPENDFVGRDGTRYPAPPEFEALHRQFAHSWRITDETSLLHYRDGESTQTFTDERQPTAVVGLSDLTADELAFAEAACDEAGVTDPQQRERCLLDVGLTGDASFALSAARAEARAAGNATFRPGRAPRWTAVLGDLFVNQNIVMSDGGGRVLAVGNRDSLGVLVALDPADGRELWRLDGVSGTCAPAVVAPDRIVAMGLRHGPLHDNRNATNILVLVDTEAGQVLDEYVPDLDGGEPSLRDCIRGLDAGGGHVVYDGGFVTAGVAVVGDELTLAWIDDITDGPTTGGVVFVDDGDRFVHGRRADGAVLEVVLADTATGDIVDRADIPGNVFTQPIGLVAIDDRIVVSVSGGDQPDVNGYTLSLLVDGDRLEKDWARPARGDGEPLERWVLSQAITTDDLVVGYLGDPVVALDPETGEVVWVLDLPSFRNTSEPMATDGTTIYDGTFGGPFAVAYSDDGELRWEVAHDDVFAEGSDVSQANSFGPVLDDVVIVTTVSNGHPVLIALDTVR